MYNSFFGFREKPFKLVPNPDYLYLSKSHEIALAHLTYATDQGDGFVVITGEVGTGKTMLCRIFLERIDDKTESAYIFNPNLDASQLLSAICNEFGIETQSGTIKELQDELNRYLINKNENGRKAILLIDEAQNLTVENLEMVRMLSNLETTRSKLLQIILVGQPELGDKLDSYELRQLSQRISLSSHLAPLTTKETEGYIQHRINIAAQRKTSLFTPGACRLVYHYSGGIPRLINIACDRSLLAAYSLNRQKISRAIVQTALRELANRDNASVKRRLLRMKWLWVGLAVGLVLGAGFFLLAGNLAGKYLRPTTSSALQHPPGPQPDPSGSGSQSARSDSVPDKLETYKIPENKILAPSADEKESRTATEERADQPVADAKDRRSLDEDRVPQEAMSAAERTVAENREPSSDNVKKDDRTPGKISKEQRLSFAQVIAELKSQTSPIDAVSAILALWEQPKPTEAQFPRNITTEAFFDIAARQYGLRLHTVENDWALVKKLNLPVIVVLRGNAGVSVYMTVIRWQDNGHVRLVYGQPTETMETNFEQLRPYLQSKAYIFWRNAFGYDFIIAQGSHRDAILTLKALLRRIGYAQIPPEPEFDPQTKEAVRDFQFRNNLSPDGLVGPLTKILMINALEPFHIPRLAADNGNDKGAGT